MIDLLKLHKPLPRYTSYPTAPEWENLPDGIYQKKLHRLAETKEPLSLYFHIPFCKTMCLFCACSVVLNRDQEKEKKYVSTLMQEIDLVADVLSERKQVTQLHFGGGTPTKLSMELLEALFRKIAERFALDLSKEIAIEIDPRTVVDDGGNKLRFLRSLGFNRVSFGVQDMDPRVQEAVKRRQSAEVTRTTFHLARELDFAAINIDLIYGLPLQTRDSFRETVKEILQLRPDRIALFSYAHVPWLKSHQKAIDTQTLPSTEEKFNIYSESRETLFREGYIAIGMDHFALKEDELAQAYSKKTLQRNFQGYTVQYAKEQVGFGMTAIGSLQGAYFQNAKTLEEYSEAIEKREFAIQKGTVLTDEDLLRRWVIHTLMCAFELNKQEFYERFKMRFDDHFQEAKEQLLAHEEAGLLLNSEEKISVTPLGELFIRNIASVFDAYLLKDQNQPQFSKSI